MHTNTYKHKINYGISKKRKWIHFAIHNASKIYGNLLYGNCITHTASYMTLYFSMKAQNKRKKYHIHEKLHDIIIAHQNTRREYGYHTSILSGGNNYSAHNDLAFIHKYNRWKLDFAGHWSVSVGPQTSSAWPHKDKYEFVTV